MCLSSLTQGLATTSPILYPGVPVANDICGQRAAAFPFVMKANKLIVAAVISAGLSFGIAAQAAEHEEESIDASKVPAAVQKAAEKEAGGAKIVRWEKEHGGYEAVIEKNGKQWGYTFDANGKMKGKHDESKEK